MVVKMTMVVVILVVMTIVSVMMATALPRRVGRKARGRSEAAQVMISMTGPLLASLHSVAAKERCTHPNWPAS